MEKLLELDFGPRKVSLKLRQAAALLAEKLGITPQQALARIRTSQSSSAPAPVAPKRTKKNKVKNAKTKSKANAKLRRRRHQSSPPVPAVAEKKSAWPENPHPGRVSIVSGGLPSLGKRR